MIAGNIIQYLSLVFLVERFTRMSLEGDCYCAVWASVTGEAIYEIFLCLSQPFPRMTSSALWIGGSYLVLAAGVLVLLNRTLARMMPQKTSIRLAPGSFSALWCWAAHFPC